MTEVGNGEHLRIFSCIFSFKKDGRRPIRLLQADKSILIVYERKTQGHDDSDSDLESNTDSVLSTESDCSSRVDENFDNIRFTRGVFVPNNNTSWDNINSKCYTSSSTTSAGNFSIGRQQ